MSDATSDHLPTGDPAEEEQDPDAGPDAERVVEAQGPLDPAGPTELGTAVDG